MQQPNQQMDIMPCCNRDGFIGRPLYLLSSYLLLLLPLPSPKVKFLGKRTIQFSTATMKGGKLNRAARFKHTISCLHNI